MDEGGEEKALKWYFVEKIKDPQAFYDNLQSNIKHGSPSAEFVWPEALTEWTGGAFGYLMRIFPPEYKSFPKFLLAKARFQDYTAMVNAALNIVEAFTKLHNSGYNYQDLNDGNFAINPANGDVLICDNDNVMGHGQSSGVQGKPRYMAPEVVRGDKRPDKLTDRFSLAVILFLLLVGNHPLEGAKTHVPCLTNRHDRKFFGTQPLFIFDAQDKSNCPVQGQHENAIHNWPYYPAYIQAAFQQSFSQESMLHQTGRLLDQQWLHHLVHLKSSIVRCPHCGNELFLSDTGETCCPDCAQRFTAPGYFKFLKKRSNTAISVPLFSDVRLYEYHMRDSCEDYRKCAAIVRVKPGKLGLENQSGYTWSVTQPKGTVSAKRPGETVLLRQGTRIDFGNNNVVEVVAN